MILCWVLTDKSGRYYWAGPGMKPVTELQVKNLPHWSSKRDAKQVADRLRQAIRLEAVPAPLRLAA